MAKIILEPHESFEHFHSEESTTTLLEGSANYQCGSLQRSLLLKEVVLTPAHQSHILTNTGNEDCVISCRH